MGVDQEAHPHSTSEDTDTAATATAATPVGFIGLGRMGDPMVRNLLRAGYPVVVHDVATDRVAALVAAGAQAAGSAAEVARRTSISITMLLSDPVLASVVLGPDGVLTGAGPDHLLCDLSTVSPTVTRDIADAAARAGVAFVRGAVAGSVQPARDGKLTVFVSGTPAEVERVRPVLSPLAATVRAVGTAEEAVYLKLVHSTLVAVYSAMLGEALAFGERGGLELNELVTVLEQGPLGSVQLSLKAPMIVSRDFEDPPSDIDTAAKDVDLVLAAARELAVPMPLTAAVRQVMAYQQARGGGKRDIWSILQAFEALAGGPA